jgi:hypothetical protein
MRLSENAARRFFWTVLVAWLLCFPVFLLTAASSRRGSSWAEVALASSLLAFVLLPAVLAWVLLLRRKSTEFPKWTRVFGWFICALYLSPLILWMGAKYQLAPPNPELGEAHLPSESPEPPEAWVVVPVPGKSPTTEALRLVDSLVSELRNGNLAHNIPPLMELDKEYVVRLLVSPSDSVEVLVEQLGRASATGQEGVRLGEKMEARLTGPSFEIEPITRELQAVGLAEPTEWRWTVKPVHSGAQSLHLDLSAHLTVSGTTLPRSIKTFEETVTVTVSVPRRVAAFIRENWQWLCTALLAPGLAWFWRKRARAEHTQRQPNRWQW